MKVLFISLIGIENISDRHLYADLMRCFIKDGHYVSIYTPLERQFKTDANIKSEVNHKITRVKTLNIQKTNIVEKIIGTFSLDYLMKRAIIRGEKNSEFDLILYTTPPITLTSTISWAKEKFKCKTYLLLKDIFPQNAVDLGMISKSSLIYKYLKNKEQKLYRISDAIGCMSEGNLKYILKENPDLYKEKTHVNPNSIEPSVNQIYDKIELRNELKIDQEKLMLIYGGNLGKPQAIDFLIELCDKIQENHSIQLYIIGNGTEYSKIENWIQRSRPENIYLINHLPKPIFDKYVLAADIGLILLDYRFTIPNYPSRLLSYLDSSKPVLCFTDEITDIGSNAKIRGYGDYSFSNNTAAAYALILEYARKEKSELDEMGINGNKFLLDSYNVINTYKKISASIV